MICIPRRIYPLIMSADEEENVINNILQANGVTYTHQHTVNLKQIFNSADSLISVRQDLVKHSAVEAKISRAAIKVGQRKEKI